MIREWGETMGWGEAVLWYMGIAGGFPSPAVFKAPEMLLKLFFCWFMQSAAQTPFLWRSLPCDLVLFWGRWGWWLSK